MNYKITNIVCSCEYNFPIDLDNLHISNVDYRKKRFNGAIIKLKKPKATILLFNNGKVISVGNKSEHDGLNSLKIISKKLNKCGYITIINNFKIINIVGVLYLENKLTTENVIKLLPNCIYEPELFPAIIYKDICKSLIFHSGKIIITGAKSLETFEGFANYIYNILKIKKED